MSTQEPPRSSLVQALARQLVEHPEWALQALRGLGRRRLVIPLAAIRVALAGRIDFAEDFEFDAAPPGLRLSGTWSFAGVKLRASAVVRVSRVDLSATRARVGLRAGEIRVRVLTGTSPLSALIDSGSLDLSRIGDLLARLPKPPPYLTEAVGDRLDIDLMRLPGVAAWLRAPWAQTLLSMLTVSGAEVGRETLELVFVPLPGGLPRVQASLRALLAHWRARRRDGAS